MMAVDLEHGVMLRNSEIKAVLSQRQPYEQWLDTNLVRLADLPQQAALPSAGSYEAEALFQGQRLFGYTHEDVQLIQRPMVLENKKPVWRMGGDTRRVALSTQALSFSSYC